MGEYTGIEYLYFGRGVFFFIDKYSTFLKFSYNNTNFNEILYIPMTTSQDLK
jgi:hypothetical protein